MLMGPAVIAEPVPVVSAQFTEPTNRYPHNVLGNLPAFAALNVTLTENTTLTLRLSESRVFEDIAPRLWDIDGDGIPEIVAVESDQQQGARLTAWSARRQPDGQHIIELRAAGDFIGTRFRWLALAGIADFTGDGLPEIAYVEMPHLAHRLVLVRLDGNQFVPVARLDGVSNHRIGDNFITGGVHDCGNGPDIVMPSADWRQTMRINYKDGGLTAVSLGPNSDETAIHAELTC